MNRLDKIVAALLFLLVAAMVFGRQGPEAGRRPVPPPAAPAPAPQIPAQPSLPERVRRPPLLDPSARDPLVEVGSHDAQAGAVLLGTAFSVDAGGVWLTARHVASDACGQVVMIIAGRPSPAIIAYLHPEADLAVLKTQGGTPALAFASEQLTVDETGFSFGYPTGVLGATEDELMGRSRMHLGGRLAGITPTLTWAETRRVPETLGTLGGMSGGPMLDVHGRVIGIVVAATTRRGRIHTVAPELLQQVRRTTGLFAGSQRQASEEIADRPEGLIEAATALSRKSRIAKVYCKVE